MEEIPGVPSDTDPQTRAFMSELIRGFSPERRLERALDLSNFV